MNKMLRRIGLQIAGFVLNILLMFGLVVRVIKKGCQQVFQSQARSTPPPCLLEPKLGQHGYVRIKDGISIHYVEKGDCSQPLMLFLHGFPEFWYSWRHQMDYFAQRGYWCVAIDMRGYNDSGTLPHVQITFWKNSAVCLHF